MKSLLTLCVLFCMSSVIWCDYIGIIATTTPSEIYAAQHSTSSCPSVKDGEWVYQWAESEWFNKQAYSPFYSWEYLSTSSDAICNDGRVYRLWKKKYKKIEWVDCVAWQYKGKIIYGTDNFATENDLPCVIGLVGFEDGTVAWRKEE